MTMVTHYVFCVLFGVALADLSFLLLHTNDMHSHFEQTDRYSMACSDENSTLCYGGFARLKSEVLRLTQEASTKGRPVVFLNAGDNYQGTPFYTYFKWPIVAKFIDMLGIDVMSLGNHEFDGDIAGLAPYIGNVSVPIVCSNLNVSLEPSLNQANLMASKVLNVSGTMVGVIGYLTPDTKFLSSTGNVQFLDEVTSIRAEAQKLRSQNVNILIALGHSGYERDQEIAQQVEDIDLVVGGHSHTFLYSGTPPDVEVPKGPYPTVVTQSSGKQVPVVQAYYATKYLGYLEVNFDDYGNLKTFNGSPILLSGELPQDKVVLQELEPYVQNISAEINRVLGYTNVLLDNMDSKCKLGECNIGNLVADSYVDYVTQHYPTSKGWTQASVGIAHAGGIRSSINSKTNVNHNGSITLGDIITVSPWGTKVVAYNMSGSKLLEALEYSVNRYEQTLTGHVNEFLQVSGLQIEYDMTRPSGQRVASVRVRCGSCEVPRYLPLEPSETYGVVMPQYLAGGGDGYSMFSTLTSPLILDDIDYMVIAKYIQQHSPVYPTIEGRLTIKGAGTKSSAIPLTSSWLMCITVIAILVKNIDYF